MLGIKQDALAFDLGLSQQAISALEQKEALDKEVLEKVAKTLQVPAEAIKSCDEEKAFNIISNNFTSHDSSTFNAVNYNCTFNPFDKVVVLYDELLKVQ